MGVSMVIVNATVQNKRKNILVTGGSGFIGTRLVADLLKAGHDVRILDKVRSRAYPDLCVVGDVRDPAAVDRSLIDAEMVYHLAAEHKDDVRPISAYYDVNVEGMKTLLQGCTQRTVNEIVFTSTVAVYGLNLKQPVETDLPKPFNDYGKSKLEAEQALNTWACEEPQRRATIVRPTVIFGENNRGNVYNLVRQIASGKFVMVGSGTNRKSMGYVGNISAYLAGVHGVPSGVRIINYADKPDLSMNELVALVRKSLGMGGRLPRLPMWIGLVGGAAFDVLARATGRSFPISRVRIRKFCADTTIGVSALLDTGFRPPYTIAEGFQKFLSHEFGV